LVQRSGIDFGRIYAFFEEKAATRDWSGSLGLSVAEQGQFLNFAECTKTSAEVMKNWEKIEFFVLLPI
jgi:hypothetical protein